MKTPLLPASFAVVVVATAAELKDPAEVAREWNLNTANPPGFSAEGGLSDRIGPSPGSANGTPARTTRRPPDGPSWGPIPRDRIYDAPNYRVPPVLPDHMPPGTKEWKYGGGTYYLLPLIPAREK